MEILSLRRRTSERRNHIPLSTLLGWSGWAAVSSGVLFLVWGYLDREGAPWYLDLAVLMLNIIVPLLFLVGLMGVYIKCRTQAGWLTIIGVVLVPTLYRQLGERNWVYGVGQECAFCLLQKLSLLLNSPLTWLLVGLTIVSLTILRKEVLRDWGFLLVAMVLFGWVYQLTDDWTGIVDVRSVHVVFGILFSLSWMLVGFALWSTKNKLSWTAKSSLRAL